MTANSTSRTRATTSKCLGTISTIITKAPSLVRAAPTQPKVCHTAKTTPLLTTFLRRWQVPFDVRCCSLTMMAHADHGFSYHHNYWQRIHTRTPALRFTHAHLFNNYFDSVVSQGIHSRCDAQVLVEGNVFVNTTEPRKPSPSSYLAHQAYGVTRSVHIRLSHSRRLSQYQPKW